MDVLKISETKIKIMLNASDVKAYGLDPDITDYNDKDTRNKVWKILDYVKKHHGFDPESAKLLIQFYPSKDGCAELFVTKLINILPKNERAISKSDGVTMLEAKRRIYKFSELSDLIKASKILKERDCIGESELFYAEDDGYYLEIAERGSLRFGNICEFAILSEFSDYVPREKHPYIIEHFKKLTSGNAVELLSKL